MKEEIYQKQRLITWISGAFLIGLLTITFIFLKICKVINWSWWWILAPLWISWILDGIGVVLGLIVIRKENKNV